MGNQSPTNLAGCLASPKVSGIRVKMLNDLWSRRPPLSGSMLAGYDFSSLKAELRILPHLVPLVREKIGESP